MMDASIGTIFTGLTRTQINGLIIAYAAAISHDHAGTYQPLDADLTALAGLGTTGVVKRTGAGTFSAGTLSSGDIPDLSATYQPLDADLTALAALSSTGFARRTGSNTWSVAAISSGDLPDLSSIYQPLDADLTAVAGLSTTGVVKRTGAGTFSAAALSSGDIPDLSATYQPLDADLTAIAALSSTGFAKRTGANTWAVAAAQLSRSAAEIVNGAAIAGTLSTTQMTTNLTETVNDHHKGKVIYWTSGTLKNQATDITAYNGSSKMLTFTAVTSAPQAGDTFVVI